MKRPYQCKHCGDTQNPRSKQTYICCKCEYARGQGAERRARGLKKNPPGAGIDLAKKKLTDVRHASARRARMRQANLRMSEFDKFAFDEAVQLCIEREKATGFKWAVDHIVPLKHKDACGLHVAANFQVVPHEWNRSKCNHNMNKFLGD